jgi:hypothetical protein
MADDITLTTITGSPVAATDEVGGKHYQWVKLAFGPNDTATKVESTVGLPVALVASAAAISNVGVTSVTPGTNPTSLGKAIDTVAGGSDVGVAVLAKRVTTTGTVTPANGDWTNLQTDDSGNLRVNISAGGSQAQVDDSAFTPGVTEVVAMALVADETSTDSVDEGDMGAARMTLDRKQIVAGYAHTAGGWLPYSKRSTGSTEDETVVKASPGQVGWLVATNLNATARYLKFYDSTNPTPGTTTPVLRFLIPPSSNGFTINFGPGVEFLTGISYAIVTEVADTGVTEVAADDVLVNLGYR